jgi:O-antigen/teichoic acid export membrane protein
MPLGGRLFVKPIDAITRSTSPHQECVNLESGDYQQPAAEHIGRLASGNARWAVATLVARQISTIGSTMVTSRYLSAADIGIGAMAITVLALIVLLDTALTWATVQPKMIVKRQIDGMFWFGVLLGIFLWLCCLFSRTTLASFYNSPELLMVIPVLGAAAFLNSLTTQPAALMKRQMRQKQTNLIDTTALMASSLGAAVLALLHFGYWTIIVQIVSMQAIRLCMLTAFSGYLPGRPQFSRDCLRLLKVGAILGVTNYVSYIQLYLASILVGRAFGAAPLGNYTKANGVRGMPTAYATMVVTDVMVAALAALHGDAPRLGAAYRKALMLTAGIGCPAGAFLYAAAPEIVHILYGPRWSAVVPLLQIMAISAVTLPISTTTIWLFLASGKVREQLIMNVFLTIATIAVMGGILFAGGGLSGLVMGETLLFALLSTGIGLVMSHRAAEIDVLKTLAIVIPIVLVSALAIVPESLAAYAVGLQRAYADYSFGNAALSLLAKFLAGSITIGIGYRIFLPEFFSGLAGRLRTRRSNPTIPAS